MQKFDKTSKKTQTEIITTVLLILIGIAAVALVSAFIINLVKNNLKGTECFDAAGQLTIKQDYSYFNTTSKILYLVVERGNKDFNLTGIAVVYGNEVESQKIALMSGKSDSKVLNSSFGKLDSIKIPSPGESILFRINTSSSDWDTKIVSVSPLLLQSSGCEKSDEKQIMQKN